MSEQPEFDLEKCLEAIHQRYTPEEKEKDEARRKELLSKLEHRLNPSELDRHLAMAQRTVDFANQNITVLLDEPESQEKQSRLEQEFTRLAEGYAGLGEYELAALVTFNPERRKQYREFQEAIDKPDDVFCNCPAHKHTDPLSGKTIEVDRQFVKKKIYSKKHNAPMPVVVCVDCGDVQVAPMPTKLRAREEGIKRAMKEAKR